MKKCKMEENIPEGYSRYLKKRKRVSKKTKIKKMKDGKTEF